MFLQGLNIFFVTISKYLLLSFLFCALRLLATVFLLLTKEVILLLLFRSGHYLNFSVHFL